MSNKRISISLDEYNMLHTEILSQKATITNLTAENNLLANDRDGYVQLLTDQNASLTAEVKLIVEERDRTFALMLHRAEKAEAENEKLRAALEDIIQDSFSVYAIQVARAAL